LDHHITTNHLHSFASFLHQKERSPATVEKYLHSIRFFVDWLDGLAVTQEHSSAWKEYLVTRGYAPATVNAFLAGINSFFQFMGWEDCHVKSLRTQRCIFRDQGKELTRREYDKLLETAKSLRDDRLFLLLQTICSTGIRVSELRFITKEAITCGQARITLKGKIRTILLPQKLCRALNRYTTARGITQGPIFRTRTDRPLGRKEIWAQMKRLALLAGVSPAKVFPHNLRSLFARVFFEMQKDIVKLADLLGHSSIETTRLYLRVSGEEHRKALEKMRLLC